ncbi:uncharacterized protein C2orf72 homolog [Sphaerodactylus townsendi]|uniref:Uncharacterized protein n=1 Tax=Sphaerodactylus townsendi TaxID=933632 RepID=A0ACB8F0F6_9SAUR|nr:uncharacterized protein C2orf72 homolog [Sphaerodactylus townsendi]
MEGSSSSSSGSSSGSLEALVERAGGRQRLLLVAERRAGEPPARALLESFARDLFGEEEPAAAAAAAGGEAGKGRGAGRRAGRGWPWCPLAFVLVRPGWLGRRRALGELVRDVRGQLAPSAGLVGVLLPPPLPPEAEEGAPEAEREAARLRLEGLLRRACAPRRPGEHEALQAAHYSPGSPQGAAPVRAAALRALRAALQLRADDLETEKRRLPTFLRCFPWGGSSQKTAGCLDKPADTSRDDGLQEMEEGVALTNLVPNGNCEEICGGAGT